MPLPAVGRVMLICNHSRHLNYKSSTGTAPRHTLLHIRGMHQCSRLKRLSKGQDVMHCVPQKYSAARRCSSLKGKNASWLQRASHLTEHKNEILERGQVSIFCVLNDNYKRLAADCQRGFPCRTMCFTSNLRQHQSCLRRKAIRIELHEQEAAPFMLWYP